jgi:hypothetical protein
LACAFLTASAALVCREISLRSDDGGLTNNRERKRNLMAACSSSASVSFTDDDLAPTGAASTNLARNMRRLRQRTMICKFVSPSHVISSRSVQQATSNRVMNLHR